MAGSNERRVACHSLSAPGFAAISANHRTFGAGRRLPAERRHRRAGADLPIPDVGHVNDLAVMLHEGRNPDPGCSEVCEHAVLLYYLGSAFLLNSPSGVATDLELDALWHT